MSRWHTTEFDMLPERAFQPMGGRNNPFGRKMTLEGGGKGGSAPDPNPGMIASAQAAQKVAESQERVAAANLAFYRQQYEELKPLFTEIARTDMEIQKRTSDQGTDYYNYAKETFRPIETKLANEAMEYNLDSKKEELASKSASDISQGYSNARDQQNRSLSRLGINPNSNRFAALNNTLTMQQAADMAGAQTKARQDADMIGYAKKMDAAALGRNYPSNSATAYGVSINAGDAAGRNYMAPGAMMGQGYAQTGQMLQGAGQTYGTAGNIYGQEFNSRMQGYSANQAASGAMWSGIGNFAGRVAGASSKPWFLAADGGQALGIRRYESGGPVSGPGGPVDDQIPAMLSNGEYVLPADTVKKVGVKKLDRLVKETHTPAVEQRRKALKGSK